MTKIICTEMLNIEQQLDNCFNMFDKTPISKIAIFVDANRDLSKQETAKLVKLMEMYPKIKLHIRITDQLSHNFIRDTLSIVLLTRELIIDLKPNTCDIKQLVDILATNTTVQKLIVYGGHESEESETFNSISNVFVFNSTISDLRFAYVYIDNVPISKLLSYQSLTSLSVYGSKHAKAEWFENLPTSNIVRLSISCCSFDAELINILIKFDGLEHLELSTYIDEDISFHMSLLIAGCSNLEKLGTGSNHIDMRIIKDALLERKTPILFCLSHLSRTIAYADLMDPICFANCNVAISYGTTNRRILKGGSNACLHANRKVSLVGLCQNQLVNV
jgi:hypothetical protein